jgi:predicted Zn-dependent peptidase
MDKLKMEGGIFSYQTTRPNLVASLNLVAHIPKEANFPRPGFDQFIKQQLTAVESQRSEPQARAFEAIGQHVTKAQIDAAFRKYINPAKITIIKAGDEAKAAAK